MQPEQIMVKKYNNKREFPLRQFPPRSPRKKKFEIIQGEYDEIQKNEVNWDVFVKAKRVWYKVLLGRRWYTITCHVVFDRIPVTNLVSITGHERRCGMTYFRSVFCLRILSRGRWLVQQSNPSVR